MLEISSASAKFLSTELVGKCFTGALWGIFAECGESDKVLPEMRVYYLFMQSE